MAEKRILQRNKPMLPYSLFVSYAVFIHSLLEPNFGDDIYFGSVLKDSSIWSWLSSRYNGLSSRVIIEFLLVELLRLPTLFWIIMDIAVFTLVLYLLCYFFVGINGNDKKQRDVLIMASLLMSYPFVHMSSAGWVATTLNYLWPFTAGLISFIPIKKYLDGRKCGIFEFPLYILLIIFASNVQQMAYVLVMVFLGFIIYFLIIRKKVKWFLLIELAFSAAGLLFHIISPANANRTFREICKHYPDYLMNDFLRKLELGITSSALHYITVPNVLFFALCLSVFIIILKKYNSILFRATAAVPLIADISYTLYYIYRFLFKSEMFDYSNPIGITPENFSSVSAYLSLFVFMAVIVCLVVSIYLIFQNTAKTLLILFILVVGYSSRMLLAFSPTIYASGTRTYFYLYISMVICIFFCIKEMLSLFGQKGKKGVYLVTVILTSAAVLINAAMIILTQLKYS
jgi:hypothetical protein